jgi:hypothetical protein
MPSRYRLFLFTYVLSVATTLIQKGAFFFTTDRLKFNDTGNLWLALVLGVTYIVGALASHALSKRAGEKRVLLAALLLQTLATCAIAACPTAWGVILGIAFMSLFNGVTWPITESYVSAGLSPSETSRYIGWYNIAWASGVPTAVWIAGPLIALCGAGMFLVSAGLCLASAAMLLDLAPPPDHHAPDHPDRPAPDQVAPYSAQHIASRCMLLVSYSLTFILSAVMPEQLKAAGVPLQLATLLFGVLDAFRVVAFIFMIRTHRWHGRRGLVAWMIVLLPLGFFATLLGTGAGGVLAVKLGLSGVAARYETAALIVAGEVIFGLAMGITYYAALYYAMVVANASVESGGAHEALIGSGFAIGPAVALLGSTLAVTLGSPAAGVVAGAAPLAVVFIVGAWWAAAKAAPRGPSSA